MVDQLYGPQHWEIENLPDVHGLQSAQHRRRVRNFWNVLNGHLLQREEDGDLLPSVRLFVLLAALGHRDLERARCPEDGAATQPAAARAPAADPAASPDRDRLRHRVQLRRLMLDLGRLLSP